MSARIVRLVELLSFSCKLASICELWTSEAIVPGFLLIAFLRLSLLFLSPLFAFPSERCALPFFLTWCITFPRANLNLQLQSRD